MTAQEQSELTGTQFEILRDAVTLARNGNIASVSRLKTVLYEKGNKAEDVDAALVFWAKYERAKPNPPEKH